MSIVAAKVFVYDNHVKFYLEETISNHQFGYDGKTLVQFDPDTNCFITLTKYVFCSSSTEILLDNRIFARIQYLLLPLNKLKPEIISVEGVPGCGKST